MASKTSLWDSGRDEEVQVNQRALIDKVLARYSGEYTVLRELLQNSDDAGAQTVEIHFNTKEFMESSSSGSSMGPGAAPPKKQLPDLKTQPLHQWSFKNDGIPFRDEDWNRLKKIAEGNPDEQKIGAFGVGFYSLFSITDDPFVSSGGQWMGFYWKDNKDQLFARRGAFPTPSIPTQTQWTTFDMPLREPSPLPGRPVDLARFLATSLTFMINLRNVSMFFDSHRLAHITKELQPPKDLPVPKNLNPISPQGIMSVKGIQSSDLLISADILRWVYATGTEKAHIAPKPSKPAQSSGFFSSLLSSFGSSTPKPLASAPPTPPPKEEDMLENVESSVLLTVYMAKVNVRLDKKMASELERATKKKPPATSFFSLIYTGKEEYDASKKEDERSFKATGSVFQGLRADLDGISSARVFIGHATSQQTGIGGHVSARFIPTVERESIDLVDRNVSVWNKELLFIGGFLSRAVYEMQINSLQGIWRNAVQASSSPDVPVDADLRAWLESKCLHVLKFFTFYPTSPSLVVSQDMETAFFACSKDRSFPILSSTGVQNARDVRYFDSTLAAFMKKIPLLSEGVSQSASLMVSSLRDRGMIQDISFTDVLAELSHRSLTEEEMIECLKWRISLNTTEVKGHDIELRRRFLDAAVFTTSPSVPSEDNIPSNALLRSERVIPLSTICSFLSTGNVIPPNVPLPPQCLPFNVSKHFRPDALQRFFGWSDLSLIDWVEYLVSTNPGKSAFEADTDVTVSAVFAERALNVIAKGWQNLSQSHQQDIIKLLRDRTVVPTRSGMKIPREAYFLNANVFPDLPIITLPRGTAIKGNLEKLLVALGVMKHVDLQIVFTRMVGAGDWGVHELMKYLVAVRTSLSQQELDRLRKTSAFPRERLPGEASQARLKPSELYEPTETMRGLGLPILDWGSGQRWKASSEEGKLLFDLGLQRHPSLAAVIALAANSPPDKRISALKYFLDNFHAKYGNFDPKDYKDIPFIPSVKPDGTKFLATPSEVFVDPGCAFLGFSVVEEALRSDALTKLRLVKDPPAGLLMPLLLNNPPQDYLPAQQYFEYLTNRIADFTSSELAQLSQTKIVPAHHPTASRHTEKEQLQMYKPIEVYFKTLSMQSSAPMHLKLFPFVDFGPKANTWLRACGVKDQPTLQEVARLLVQDPKMFLELAGGSGGYLDVLRQMATFQGFSSDLISQMKKSRFLLGSRREPRHTKTQASNKADLEDLDDDYETTFDLLQPHEVIIVDDTNAYSLFSDTLFGAPQEDALEAFYHVLGSPYLTSLIKEEYRPISIETTESRVANETRNLIIQRFPLFLHERNVKCRIQPEWLSHGSNFQVRVCGKLTLVRALELRGQKLAKVQEASAAAKMVKSFSGGSSLTLYISKNDKLDMYEVAHSMCKLLLKIPKVNDSLLFMTILSTDLRALRRRGFNVDRILHQQKVEKQLAEARRVAESQRRQDIAAEQAQAEVLPEHNSVKHTQGEGQLHPGTKPLLPQAGALNSVKENIRHQTRQMQDIIPNIPGFWPSSPAVGPRPSGPSRNQDSKPTPMSEINRNIQTAIAGCRAEHGSVLNNQEQMTRVKETSEGGYCDVSGTDQDFDLIGTLEGFRFFIARGITSPQIIVEAKRSAIQRFARQVVNPLLSVYQLPTSSIHIFYDERGPLIAFNRGGSLFLNLRYYEGWHDPDVLNGQPAEALVSWYHTLAHEIAHNLVKPHDSEHEFYFSAICENHLLKFTQVLNGVL